MAVFQIDTLYCSSNIAAGVFKDYKECFKALGSQINNGLLPPTGFTVNGLGTATPITPLTGPLAVNPLVALNWLYVTELIGFGLFLWGLSFGLMSFLKVFKNT